jgi:hypothetical protein
MDEYEDMIKEIENIMKKLNLDQKKALGDRIVSFVVSEGLNEYELCPKLNKFVMSDKFGFHSTNY